MSFFLCSPSSRHLDPIYSLRLSSLSLSLSLSPSLSPSSLFLSPSFLSLLSLPPFLSFSLPPSLLSPLYLSFISYLYQALNTISIIFLINMEQVLSGWISILRNPKILPKQLADLEIFLASLSDSLKDCESATAALQAMPS